jgi:transketolase C-terminal domain/subunit
MAFWKPAENEHVVARRPVGSMKLNAFIKEFPKVYPCGIAEANMIKVAAGLTIGGKILYHYLANFQPEGCTTRYDSLWPTVVKKCKNLCQSCRFNF